MFARARAWVPELAKGHPILHNTLARNSLNQPKSSNVQEKESFQGTEKSETPDTSLNAFEGNRLSPHGDGGIVSARVVYGSNAGCSFIGDSSYN